MKVSSCGRWWRYFVMVYVVLVCLILGVRWLFTTQFDRLREPILEQFKVHTGLTLEAQSFEGGFHRIWPSITLTNVTLRNEDGSVGLTLPKVYARLSWKSLWHLKPYFETFSIENPSFNIERLTPTRFRVGGFTVDVPAIAGTALDTSLDSPREGELRESPVTAPASDTESLTSNETSSSASTSQALVDWILGQHELSLINGTVDYQDFTQGRPEGVMLVDVNAVFENGLIKQFVGLEANLVEGSRTVPLAIKAEITKDWLTREATVKSPTTIYANLPRVNLGRLAQAMGLKGMVKRALGSAEIWAELADEQLLKLDGHLSLNQLWAQWGPGLEPFKVDALDSWVHYQHEASRAEVTDALRLDRVTLITGNTKLVNRQYALTLIREPDYAPRQWTFSAKKLDLGDLSQFLPALPVPEGLRTFIQTQQPSGLLSAFSITHVETPEKADTPGAWAISSDFEYLTLKADPKTETPGFTNLAGHVHSTNHPGEYEFKLDSAQAQLHFPGLFIHPVMTLDRLKLDGSVHLDSPMRVEVDSFTVSNADAKLTGRASWKATGGAGTLDLTGTIHRGQVAQVPKYLPLVIGRDVIDWLSGSLEGGSVKEGSFVVRGELDQFPWEKSPSHQARFAIEGVVEGAQMRLDPLHPKKPDWPSLSHINAKVAFVGDGFTVQAKSGKSMGLSLENVTVGMKRYEDGVLNVEGLVKGDLNHGVQYLSTALPIRDVLGKTLASAKASGPFSTQLKLAIPLSDTAGALKFHATTTLENNSLNLGFGLPTLTKLKGLLVVSEKGAQTPNGLIEGKLPNGPFSLAASTQGANTLLQMQGGISVPEILHILEVGDPDKLYPFFKGSTQFTGNVTIDQKTGNWLLNAQSNLLGVQSDLPAPLTLQQGQTQPLLVTLSHQARQYRLAFDAPRMLGGLVTYDTVDGVDTLTGVNLSVGAAPRPTKVTPGITVDVEVPSLDPLLWRDTVVALMSRPTLKDPKAEKALKDEEAKAANTPTELPLPVQRIDVKVRELTNTTQAEMFKALWLKEQNDTSHETMPDFDVLTGPLHVTVSQRGSVWQVSLNGAEFEGQAYWQRQPQTGHMLSLGGHLKKCIITPSMAMALKTVMGDEEQLRFETQNAQGQKTGTRMLSRKKAKSTVWSPLPTTDLTIDALQYGKMYLGTVAIRATSDALRRPYTWTLHHLGVSSPAANFVAHGAWKVPGDSITGKTQLQIEGTIKNLGDQLNQWDLKNVIRQGSGKVVAHVDWPGSPLDFDLDETSGDFNVSIERGQILQIEPGAGRLMSLLSFQHLLRRMTLDFSDVVNKGFSFDKIYADGVLLNGVMTMPRGSLAGSAATVFFDGDIDWPQEVIHMKATVIPSVNFGVPGLALSLLNPVVGVGALISQFVIGDQVNNLFKVMYTIDGSISDPEVKEVGRTEPKPVPVQAPPAQPRALKTQVVVPESKPVVAPQAGGVPPIPKPGNVHRAPSKRTSVTP